MGAEVGASHPLDGGLDDLRAAYDGGLQPVDLVEAVLARIEEADDPAIWIDVEPVASLRQAAVGLAEVDRDRAPLWGVPFGVKDNIDVAGRTTTVGLPGAARTAVRTATVVQRLLAAGAVYVGKTNLDQLATGLVGTRSPYGTPRNPLDPTLIPGGSSSGSAVAVARRQVSFALGTDTAGSGRVPAAMCGIVGIKGSPGARPMDGVVPASPTLDCVSTFARSVADGLLVESVMAASPWPVAGGRLRVAMADPDGAEGLRLRLLGHEVVGVDLAPFHEAGDLLYQGPWLADRTAALSGLLDRGLEGTVGVVQAVVARGAAYSGIEVFAAMHRLAEIQAALVPWWREVDALVVPTVPWAPTVAAVGIDPIGLNARLGRNTTFANLLGLAAIAVPGGDGPGGVTVLGPPGRLAAVAGVAAALHDEHLLAGAAGSVGRIHLAISEDQAVHVLAGLGAELVEHTSTRGTHRGARSSPPSGSRADDLDLELGRAALAPDDGHGPRPVAIWSIAPEGLGALVALLPPSVSLGTVSLVDDRWVRALIADRR